MIVNNYNIQTEPCFSEPNRNFKKSIPHIPSFWLLSNMMWHWLSPIPNYNVITPGISPQYIHIIYQPTCQPTKIALFCTILELFWKIKNVKKKRLDNIPRHTQNVRVSWPDTMCVRDVWCQQFTLLLETQHKKKIFLQPFNVLVGWQSPGWTYDDDDENKNNNNNRM